MDELIQAVRTLRQRLGDSQQAFATRLGLSLRAIANYEAGRRPTPSVLFSLSFLAGQSGHKDLQEVFAAAYPAAMRDVVSAHSEEEQVWVGLVLTALRSRTEESELREIGKALLGHLQKAIASGRDDTDHLRDALIKARRFIAPTAQEEALARAKSLAAEIGGSVDQALKQVLMTDSDLKSRYLAEMIEEYGLQPGDDIRIAGLPEPQISKKPRQPKKRSTKK